jgi:molybdopterin/thiamine biosynthesis adenylyltransferase
MNEQQLLRYSRQILLPDMDMQGQQRLLESKVLIVGLGGLGCPVALYLAAAGVGELWLADFDTVELSNLQRQIAHTMADINRPKVISVQASIAAINPDIKTIVCDEKLLGDALIKVINEVDLVVDASDSFQSRDQINRVCVATKTPWVSGAAIRAEGQVIAFDATSHTSPCYRCLYVDDMDDELLSCSESGVLAPLVGVIGSMQALQAIKLLSGYGSLAIGELMVLDAYSMQWSTLKLTKQENCPVCSC